MFLRVIIALVLLVACAFIGSLVPLGSAGSGVVIGFIVGIILACIVLSYKSSNKEVSQRDIENSTLHAREADQRYR